MAYLNMTNSSHQCPGEMEEVAFSGKRVCGRSSSITTNSGSCASATYSTDALYSKVCGRITGYQYGNVHGFQYSRQSIDSYYVDGVTVTHGPPGNREHVWTFVNGNSESRTDACPCAPNAAPVTIPTFINQDYFCEAGSVNYPTRKFYSNDPLWDGDGCTVSGNTCCEFNNPPYFTKQLSYSTHNNLEVRACSYFNRHANADTLIELIELYIKL